MSSQELTQTEHVDVVVIGAGPAGLSVVAKLLENNDTTVNDSEHARSLNLGPGGRTQLSVHPKIAVIDPNPGWMDRWKRMFTGLSIQHLRSTIGAHPCPFDVESLRRFASEHGRQNELMDLVQEDSMVNSYMKMDFSVFDHHEPSTSEMSFSSSHRSSHKTNRQRAKQTGFGSVQFTEADRNDFVLPGSSLFADFCDSLVSKYQLDEILIQGWVSGVQPIFADCQQSIPCAQSSVDCIHNSQPGLLQHPERFIVTLSDGREFSAKSVVVAIGNTNITQKPSWIRSIPGEFPAGSLAHAWDLVDARQEDVSSNHPSICSSQPGCPKHHDFADCSQDSSSTNLRTSAKGSETSSLPAAASERLLVVGGGLTSAQLCIKALEHARSKSNSLHVTLVIRKPYLDVKPYDVDLAWFGRFKNLYSCRFLQEADMGRRLQIIQRARRGGSISPEAHRQLQEWVQSGHLNIKTSTQVEEARWDSSKNRWSVQFNGLDSDSCDSNNQDHDEFDRIWLATGSVLDIRRESVFRSLLQCHSSGSSTQSKPELLGSGIPALQSDLRWLPGWNLFVVGAYAQLQIGPNAGNLFGARVAAGRVRDELISVLQGEYRSQSSQHDVTPEEPLKVGMVAPFDHQESSSELSPQSSSVSQRKSNLPPKYEEVVRNTRNWFSALEIEDDDDDSED